MNENEAETEKLENKTEGILGIKKNGRKKVRKRSREEREKAAFYELPSFN